MSRWRHRTALTGVAAAIVVVLAGCAPAPAAPTAATTSAPATPVDTPTPTPTLNLDDPASWLIDFTSVGPVTLGSPIADQPANMTHFTNQIDPASGSNGQLWSAPATPSIGIAPPEGDNSSPNIGSISVIGYSASSTATESAANSPKTARGIGTGSTINAMLAAYPGIEKTGTYSDLTDFYGVPDGSGHWIVFVTRNDLGLIITIHVGTSKVQPGD